MISLLDAIFAIDNEIKNHTVKTKILTLQDALNHISATSIKCTIALPPFDNSAMDGYAVCGDGKRFEIVSKIFAGDTKSYTLKAKEAYRIFTGAKVPKNCDYVIPQEMVELNEDRIILSNPLKANANIRKKGEDINIGDTILDLGDRINSAHIALLASQGIDKVEVFCKPKVAVFSSGNELKMAGDKIKSGEIYNSNIPYILARSKEMNTDTYYLGECKDDKKYIKGLIKKGLDADLMVTSGGLSVGEADFIKEAFLELGLEIIFSKIAIKPGKPTTFGKIGNTYILNLPGNPLATALNFEIIGKYIINKISNSNSTYLNTISAILSEEISSPKPVSSIIPGNFDGKKFYPLKGVMPGNVNVLNRANSIIVINESKDLIKKGGFVKIIPISWNFFTKEFVDFTS